MSEPADVPQPDIQVDKNVVHLKNVTGNVKMALTQIERATQGETTMLWVSQDTLKAALAELKKIKL